MGSPDIREMIRQSVKEKSQSNTQIYKKDLASFAEYIFKDPNGKPIELQWFHKEMLNLFSNKRRVLVLAPRGSGKSSLASLVYPCFKIMENRDIRIIIVSNTIDLAKEWLRSIERTMIQNQEYIALTGGDFIPGRAESGSWTETDKVIKGRSAHATHVTLKAVGVKGSLLGKRADLIIADDILDPENTATPYQREAVSNWFHQVLLPILDPKGQLIVIGTRFARGDLYEELWDSWTKTDEFGKPYVRGAGVLKIVAEPEEGVSYWPDRFPYEDLLSIKKTNSFAWHSQYMNIPIDLTGSFLRKEWLENYWMELPQRDGETNLTYYVGMDPSITGKGDHTGICVVGVEPGKNKIYVIDVIKEKANLERQAEMLETICKIYKPALVNVESNAAQQIITQFLERHTMLPINQSLTRTDKAARMANLAAHFQNGRILMKGRMNDTEFGPRITFHPSMDPIVEEWIGFRPKDAQDDALDALEKAVEVAAWVTDPEEGSYNPSRSDLNNNYYGRQRHFRLFR